jgi:hypothetical protein
MVEAKTHCYVGDQKTKTTKQQTSVEIEAYLKPSWVLASTKRTSSNDVLVKRIHLFSDSSKLYQDVPRCPSNDQELQTREVERRGHPHHSCFHL